MKSVKTTKRLLKSVPASSGDRRGGSVGERPELAGSRDSGDRAAENSHKTRRNSVEDEIAADSDNRPILGGEYVVRARIARALPFGIFATRPNPD